MSKPQGVGRVKSGSFACTKVKHYSRSSAQQHIEEIKNKNVRGTKGRMKVITCKRCTKRERREVFHVGHDNGKKGVQR